MKLKMHNARGPNQLNRVIFEWKSEELAKALVFKTAQQQKDIEAMAKSPTIGSKLFAAYLIASAVEDAKNFSTIKPQIIIPE